MARLHLFEWEDQSWLPGDLRNIITDHLRYTFSAPRAANLRETIADIIVPPLQRCGAEMIIDVCSGGGGPLPALLPLLEKGAGKPLTARLTDLYPNMQAFMRLQVESGGKAQGESQSVSAFDVPARLGAFQTLFTAFHHFKPQDAKRILADAAAKRRTLVVIEPFNRAGFLPVAIGGLVFGLVRTPKVGPVTLSRMLWTYPIPISPLVLAWDGGVSCLRAYSDAEMLALAREAAPDYQWQAGVRAIPGAPKFLSITYLIGEPPR